MKIEPTQAEIDQERERKINEAYFHLQTTHDPHTRREALDTMEKLIKERSPEQVATMEAWHKGTW
jgi:hypothetical protein